MKNTTALFLVFVLVIAAVCAELYIIQYCDNTCSSLDSITYIRGDGCYPIGYSLVSKSVVYSSVSYCNTTAYSYTSNSNSACSSSTVISSYSGSTYTCNTNNYGVSFRVVCDYRFAYDGVYQLANVTQYGTSSCSGTSGSVSTYQTGCVSCPQLSLYKSRKASKTQEGNLIYNTYSDSACTSQAQGFTLSVAQGGCDTTYLTQLTWAPANFKISGSRINSLDMAVLLLGLFLTVAMIRE